MDQLSAKARSLSNSVATNVFNLLSLYDAQANVLERLALMRFVSSPIKPSSVLLIHPTGGGKSLVRDVYSVLFRGVTLTIVPILSLGSDQKVKLKKKARQSYGRIIPIHLDEIRDIAQAKMLIADILKLPSDTTKSIVIFASPQCLTKPHWEEFFVKLHKNEFLRLIAIDEIQLFVHYGLSFRKEFASLSTTLFKHIRISPNSHELTIPTLFMTATCTVDMVQQLEKLTGLVFDPAKTNIFWPGPQVMMNNTVKMNVIYSTRPLHSFQSTVSPYLRNNRQQSFVFNANSKVLIDRCCVKYGNWLDSQTFHSDFLKLVGPMKKEEKFHITKLFCGEKLTESNEQKFNPQVLFATSGAANAGIDNPQVHGVFRSEAPPLIVDCLQERGRAGRRPGASPQTDFYTITISLESIVILLHRIFGSTAHKGKYQTNLLKDLDNVLASLVIPKACLNSKFAWEASKPYKNRGDLPPQCNDACSYCVGDYKKMFPPVIKEGVCLVLMDLYSGENRISGTITFDPVLLTAIKKYPDCNRLVFGVDTNKSPTPIQVKKLILVLLAAKILCYTATVKETTENEATNKDKKYNITVTVRAVLGHSHTNDGNRQIFAMDEDSYWSTIKLRPPLQ